MRGTEVLQQGPYIPGPPGADWIVINGGGDFNADGMADILWYNPTTNRMTVWLMCGTEPLEIGPEIPGPPGPVWYNAASLDFNADGMADVLWYNHVTNLFSVWLMAGTQVLERGPEILGPPGGGWDASFGADFDRDGLADIFWYNATTDRMAVWLMASTEVRERGPEIPTLPSPDWGISAVADFNHDFIPDEVWFNRRTGHISASLMRYTRRLEQTPEIPGPPGDGWIAGNCADLDGDGMFDVVWLNTNPLRIQVWLMNGFVPVVIGPEIPGPPGSGR
jgi:hypothetical protein